ncbi:MAG: hypothetical protein WD358_05850 [Nitriliruptoraceae bacterium]
MKTVIAADPLGHHSTVNDDERPLTVRVTQLEHDVAIIGRHLDQALVVQDQLVTALTIMAGALESLTEPDAGTR